MTKHIIIVGRGHGGTRAIAETLHRSDIPTGELNGHHYDMVPPFAMYNAVGMFGKFVKHYPPYRWDFSEALAMAPPPRFRKLVNEYLEPLLSQNLECFFWKLPETILALPWLIQMFPDAYYIHWVRDGRDSCLKWHQSESFEFFNIPAEMHYESYYNGAVSWHYIESLVEVTPKPEHWLTVRFEDFVLHQNEMLVKLVEYLDISLVKIDVHPEAIGRWHRIGYQMTSLIDIMDYHLRRYGYLEEVIDGS